MHRLLFECLNRVMKSLFIISLLGIQFSAVSLDCVKLCKARRASQQGCLISLRPLKILSCK